MSPNNLTDNLPEGDESGEAPATAPSPEIKDVQNIVKRGAVGHVESVANTEDLQMVYRLATSYIIGGSEAKDHPSLTFRLPTGEFTLDIVGGSFKILQIQMTHTDGINYKFRIGKDGSTFAASGPGLQAHEQFNIQKYIIDSLLGALREKLDAPSKELGLELRNLIMPYMYDLSMEENFHLTLSPGLHMWVNDTGGEMIKIKITSGEGRYTREVALDDLLFNIDLEGHISNANPRRAGLYHGVRSKNILQWIDALKSAPKEAIQPYWTEEGGYATFE